MIRRNGSFSPDLTLQDRLLRGYNNGAWNGVSPAILSSVAATAAKTNDAVGLTNAYLANATSFGGVGVISFDRMIGYAIYGDATLDRTVNFDDLLVLAQQYGSSAIVAPTPKADAVVAARAPFSNRRIADTVLG